MRKNVLRVICTVLISYLPVGPAYTEECGNCVSVHVELSNTNDMVNYLYKSTLPSAERKRLASVVKDRFRKQFDAFAARTLLGNLMYQNCPKEFCEEIETALGADFREELRARLLATTNVNDLLSALSLVKPSRAERQIACATILADGTDQELLQSVGGYYLNRGYCVLGSVVDQIMARLAATNERYVAHKMLDENWGYRMGLSREQVDRLREIAK